MAKVLHRDKSAGNIMITDEGRGLLVDWDLSKLLITEGEAESPSERTVWVATIIFHSCLVHDFYN